MRNKGGLNALVALVGVAILVSFNIWYTGHLQATSDNRWCSLMVGLDDRYQNLPSDPPPSSEATDLANKIHQLRVGLHCPPSSKVVTIPASSPTKE